MISDSVGTLYEWKTVRSLCGARDGGDLQLRDAVAVGRGILVSMRWRRMAHGAPCGHVRAAPILGISPELRERGAEPAPGRSLQIWKNDEKWYNIFCQSVGNIWPVVGCIETSANHFF